MGNASTKPRFEGYCYKCEKYGHREYECRYQKKPYQTNQRKNNALNNACLESHKFRHLRNNCKTQVRSTNQAKDKDKGKSYIEKIKKEMNQKQKKRIKYGIVEKIELESPNPMEKVIMLSQTKKERYVWNFIFN